jgi:glycosyltransferase involved in cell wall biosynthesis
LGDPHTTDETVSVLIPTFNGADTIERTLKSVLNQDIQTEIVIVDDYSLDQTLDKATNVLKSASRPYKIVRHDHNLGLSASLNDGLNSSRGDNVLVLHQDCELMRPDWISTAMKCMDEKVAVVTGYYGISDPSEMNLAKKTFGLLRRQIHARPTEKRHEIVNFSEGKCDLYKMKVLQSMGGFPEQYRIAGEDLSISTRVRQRGYRILKNYDLPVIQRYGGRAESFQGNIQKEFEFGKAMGGIVGEHKFSLIHGGLEEGYGRSRTLNRIIQVVQTVVLVSFALVYLLTLNTMVLFLCLVILILRYSYYAVVISTGLRDQRNLVKHRVIDALWMPAVGILMDPIYSVGVAYGMLKWLGRRRI